MTVYVLLQKTGRKSQSKVSLGGVANLFTTPPAVSPTTPPSTGQGVETPDSVLYADLPDTPIGPGEMMVSPLSSAKSSGRKSFSTGKKGRKSVDVLGVKELFKRKSMGAADTEGVKQLFKTPKEKGRSKSVSPAGLKRLMATPKSKRSTDVSSPSGVAALFQTPEVENMKTPKKQAAPVTKSSAKKTVSRRQGKAKAVREPVLVITPINETKQEQVKVGKKTPVKRRTTRRGQKATSPAAVKTAASQSPLKPRRGQKRTAPTTPTSPVEPKSKKVKAASPLIEITESALPKRASLKTLKQTPVKARITRRGVKVATPTKTPTPKKLTQLSPATKRSRRRMPEGPVAVEQVGKKVETTTKSKKAKPPSPQKPTSPSPVKTKRETRGKPVSEPAVALTKKQKESVVKKLASPSTLKTERDTRGRPARKTAKVVKSISPVKEPETLQLPDVKKSTTKKTSVRGRSTRRGAKTATPTKQLTPVVRRASRKRPALASPTAVLPETVSKKIKVATPVPVEKEHVTPQKIPSKGRATRRRIKTTPKKVFTPQKPSPVKIKKGFSPVTSPMTEQVEVIEPAVPTTKKQRAPAVKKLASPSPLKTKRGTRGRPAHKTPVKVAKPITSTKEQETQEYQMAKKNPTPTKLTPVKGRSTRRGAKAATPAKQNTSITKRGLAQTSSTLVEAEPAAKESKVVALTAAKMERSLTPKKVIPVKSRTTRRGLKISPKKVSLPQKTVQKKAEATTTAKKTKSPAPKKLSVPSPVKTKRSTRGKPGPSPVKEVKSSKLAVPKIKKQSSPVKTKRVTRARTGRT